jgi:WD40 repeat protein
MSISELRDAIIQPAQLVGLQIDSRVVTEVANNVLGEQAALPLLQFSLQRLWENRDLQTNQITWELYRKFGAGRRALCDTAEQMYKQIKQESADDAEILKEIFVSMVQFDQALTAVSRLTLVSDLYALDNNRDRVDRLVGRLVQSGLLRLKRGSTPDDDQIELAHEALIQDWRLRQWSEVKREPVALRQLLGVAVRDWVSQNKNDESALYTGTQLARVIEAHFKGLTPDEEEFISKSEELCDRQKARHNLWVGGVIVLLVLLVLSVSALGSLTYIFLRASAFETAAMLAGDADEVIVSNRQRGLLLAAEAVKKASSKSVQPLDAFFGTKVPTEVMNSLLDEVERGVARVDLPTAPTYHVLPPRLVAVSPNTRYMATASGASTGITGGGANEDAVCFVQLWSLGVAEVTAPTLRWYSAESDCPEQQITKLLFNLDSTQLMIVKTNGTVDIIELDPEQSQPEPRQVRPGNENSSQMGAETIVAMSPTWRWMVTVNAMGTAELQEVDGWQGGEIISHTLATHGVPVTQTVFSPDEKWLVSVDISNTLELWNLMDLDQPPGEIPAKGDIIRFDPRSRWLAVASTVPPSVYLRDLAAAGGTAHKEYILPMDFVGQSIHSMAIQQWQSSTGELFAVGYDDGTIRVWNLDDLGIKNPKTADLQSEESPSPKVVVSDPLVEIYEHSGAVEQLDFSVSEANRLMSASADGRVRILEISNSDYKLIGTQYGRERPYVAVIFDSNRPGSVVAIDKYTVLTWRQAPIPSDVSINLMMSKILKQACEQAGGALTPSEKRKYLEESKDYVSACEQYRQSGNSDSNTEVSK